MSNALVGVALVGMRTAEEVRRNVSICENCSGRIDVAKMHERYVT